jgi:hypothetical protein
MLKTLSSVTCRVVYGLYGAAMAVRQEHAPFKDALAAFRLLASPHTEGLTIDQTLDILFKARMHKLDPFDLWMVFDGYVCDDIDAAVIKTLEIRALYERPRSFSRKSIN